MIYHSPYDGLPRWLIKLFYDRRRLSNDNIDRIIGAYGTIEPDINDGLGACILYDYAHDITTAQTYQERRAKADYFLTWFDRALRRNYVAGELMDYTTRRKGQTSLMGNKIDYCPVCGRKGAINPIYRIEGKVVHWGHTIHKSRMFFMGEEPIERCEWPSGSDESPDRGETFKMAITI